MIKPRIPKGGFFAAKEPVPILEDLEYRLKKNGATVKTFPEADIILGAWSEFKGQGLWFGENVAVAYDLDLTNMRELKRTIGWHTSDNADAGELLWQLYKKKGNDFLDDLRGPFGFAMWV